MADERVDAAIDEVARELTRGELPPDFRDRVIARLESGDARHRTWRPALVAAPLAIAAVVLLAVSAGRAPRRSNRPPEVRQQVQGQVRDDVVLKPLASPGQAVAAEDRGAKGSRRTSRVA